MSAAGLRRNRADASTPLLPEAVSRSWRRIVRCDLFGRVDNDLDERVLVHIRSMSGLMTPSIADDFRV